MPSPTRTSSPPLRRFTATYDITHSNGASHVEIDFLQHRQVHRHAGFADHHFFTPMGLPEVVTFFEQQGQVTSAYHGTSREAWAALIRLRLDAGADALLMVSVDKGSPVTTVSMALSTLKPEASAHASTYLRDLEQKFPKPTLQSDEIMLTFWALTAGGPEPLHRPITPIPWETTRSNYPHSVEPILSRIVTEGPDSTAGRLLLLHGEPGTGKSSYVRALAAEWRDSASVEVITDPEAFFGNPQYMLDILLRPIRPVGRRNVPSWKLLVLEDTGELLADTARTETGQGLSRLLNLTAGLLGEGMKTLFLFTSNEELGSCHPAVIRPGRCRATVELQAFPVSEANQWLRAHGSAEEVSSPATLADLFAVLKGGNESLRKAPRRALGFTANRVQPSSKAS